MYDYNTHRMSICEYCGKRFMDECGDSFCSSRCERQWENEHASCDHCGDEVGEDDLKHGLCENCQDELLGE